VERSTAIPGARVFVARHAKGVPRSGAPANWRAILRYPSVEATLAFYASPGHAAIEPPHGRSARWRSFAVECLAGLAWRPDCAARGSRHRIGWARCGPPGGSATGTRG
jgi:hypothetical protein